MSPIPPSCSFFFTHPATTDIYTLSLHDALPILPPQVARLQGAACGRCGCRPGSRSALSRFFARHGITIKKIGKARCRSEEHTSELQSRGHLVCRLLLEKKKKDKVTLLIIT